MFLDEDQIQVLPEWEEQLKQLDVIKADQQSPGAGGQ